VTQIYFNAATKKERKREEKNLPTVTNYKKSTEKILQLGFIGKFSQTHAII
jgi:hypothetical protein